MERSDLFYYRETSSLMQQISDFSKKHELSWPLFGELCPEAVAGFFNQSIQNQLAVIQNKLHENLDITQDSGCYLAMIRDFQRILQEAGENSSTLCFLCHNTFLIGIAKLQQSLFQNDENRFFAQLTRELSEAENAQKAMAILYEKNRIIKSFVTNHIQALESQCSAHTLDFADPQLLKQDPTELLQEARLDIKGRSKSVIKILKALEGYAQLLLDSEEKLQKILASLSWIHNDDRCLQLTALVRQLQEKETGYRTEEHSPNFLSGMESMSRLSLELHNKIRNALESAISLRTRLEHDPLKKVMGAYLLELFNRMPSKFTLHIQNFSCEQIIEWENQPSSAILDGIQTIWEIVFQRVFRDVATIHEEFITVFNSMRYYLLTYLRTLEHPSDRDRILLWNDALQKQCDRVFSGAEQTGRTLYSRSISRHKMRAEEPSHSAQNQPLNSTEGLPPLIFSRHPPRSLPENREAPQAPVITIRKKFSQKSGSFVDFK